RGVHQAACALGVGKLLMSGASTAEQIEPRVAPPPLAPDAEYADDPTPSSLLRHRLFVVGAACKIVVAFLFGSHFATRWFAPFLYELARSPLHDPWARFLDRGEPLAFPYGPGMATLVGLPFLPGALIGIDPSSHVGMLLLRVTPFAADVVICA